MFSYVFVLLSLLVLSSIHFYITYLPLQIRKMDLEARSLQPSVKAMLLAKLREYKSDLSNLKKEFKRLTSPNSDEAAREELLETGMADTHLVYLGP